MGGDPVSSRAVPQKMGRREAAPLLQDHLRGSGLQKVLVGKNGGARDSEKADSEWVVVIQGPYLSCS